MENRILNKIIYDWLSFTSHIHSPQVIIEELGMQKCNWQSIKGANGYKDRLYFESVSIHYNGREDMGVWCEMSGQGCRTFETYGNGNYQYIFDEIIENSEQMNITRLDIAYDDFIGLLPLDTIVLDTLKGAFVSRSRYYETIISTTGKTVNHGSMKSDIRVRIYDKAKERGRTDIEHWVRCELQLRRILALGFIKLTGELGKNYFDVLNNYLRYIVPTDNVNLREANTAMYWAKFLESYETVSIFDKPGTEYNELNLANFVFQQAGNSIDTYIKCFGEDKFFEELKNRGTILSEKQKALVDKYTKGENTDVKGV